MIAKVEITGTLEVVTGLHIGGNSAFSAIGAVDSPVISDTCTGEPIIPGSSLKGKMRSLLAKQYNQRVAHNPNEDADCLTDLFGSSKPIKIGKLLFSDMYLINENKFEDIRVTEIKFENNIDRLKAVATPRQIERVVRGAQFGINLIYEVKDEKTMKQDFVIIRDGLRLLKYDYLGGSGSRGYGKVKFLDLYAAPVIGEVDETVMNECNDLLQEI